MKDFLTDDNGDIRIENGDLVIGNSELQHQHDILHAHKGAYKEHPEIGVGISDAIHDDNQNTLLSKIRANFEYDGMVVTGLKISEDGTLIVDANY